MSGNCNYVLQKCNHNCGKCGKKVHPRNGESHRSFYDDLFAKQYLIKSEKGQAAMRFLGSQLLEITKMPFVPDDFFIHEAATRLVKLQEQGHLGSYSDEEVSVHMERFIYLLTCGSSFAAEAQAQHASIV
jgi:hypothetical protein